MSHPQLGWDYWYINGFLKSGFPFWKKAKKGAFIWWWKKISAIFHSNEGASTRSPWTLFGRHCSLARGERLHGLHGRCPLTSHLSQLAEDASTIFCFGAGRWKARGFSRFLHQVFFDCYIYIIASHNCIKYGFETSKTDYQWLWFIAWQISFLYNRTSGTFSDVDLKLAFVSLKQPVVFPGCYVCRLWIRKAP